MSLNIRRTTPSLPRRIREMPSVRRAAIAAIVLLAAGAAPAPETAFPGSLALKQGRLRASLDLSAAFPPEMERALRDGLTHVVTLHLSLVPEGGGTPLAAWAREIEVLWDVWEERFGVTAADPEHPLGRALQFRDFRALRGFLAEAHDLDLGPAAPLGDGRWAMVARVELDPVKELLERTRDLFGGQRAGQGPDGGAPSVLGAMASYLLGGTGGEGQARFFRSRPFSVRDGTLK